MLVASAIVIMNMGKEELFRERFYQIIKYAIEVRVTGVQSKAYFRRTGCLEQSLEFWYGGY